MKQTLFLLGLGAISAISIWALYAIDQQFEFAGPEAVQHLVFTAPPILMTAIWSLLFIGPKKIIAGFQAKLSMKLLVVVLGVICVIGLVILSGVALYVAAAAYGYGERSFPEWTYALYWSTPLVVCTTILTHGTFQSMGAFERKRNGAVG